MSDTSNFAKLVPGFDFLQGLVKNAGSVLPSIGQWVAPTLDPDELQKRIDELKTVQFWLEQNAKMLATTLQALEVQRMTLSTLKTMNVQMTDLRDAMKVPPAAAESAAPAGGMFGADALMQAARSAMGNFAGMTRAATSAAEPAAASASASVPEPEAAPAAPAPDGAAAEPPRAAAAGMVDPMQWWSALTQQFTQLAAAAMNDGAADNARNLADAMVKQGIDAAGETIRKAVTLPVEAATQAMAAGAKAAQAAQAPAPPARTAGAKKTSARKTPVPKTPARKTASSAAKPRAR